MYTVAARGYEMKDRVTLRIRGRRLLRNASVFLRTSAATILYRIGGALSQTKKPGDATDQLLQQMRTYCGLSVGGHCTKYRILVDDAKDFRRPYPTRDEFDLAENYPQPFLPSDFPDRVELTECCEALGYDPVKIQDAFNRDQVQVINWLRLTRWEAQKTLPVSHFYAPSRENK
jgi:hypothetical protein